ncbi:MAG: hypothetical protein QE484_01375 [Rhizobium sp.]|nr:hypothetical protein [Rhizobium sp.]
MDDPALLPSLLARSALARLCFAALLIALTWGGIQWAVSLP